MANKLRIYISGAITGTEDFRERFLEAEKGQIKNMVLPREKELKFTDE